MSFSKILCWLCWLGLSCTVRSAPVNGSNPAGGSDSGRGYMVFRFVPTSTKDLAFLKTLRLDATKFKLNFWKERIELGHPVDVMIPAHSIEALKKLCNYHRVTYVVIVEDVQKLILENRRLGQARQQFASSVRRDFVAYHRPYFDFTDYQSYDQMRQFMRSLQARYPRNVKVHVIGKSREGRNLEMIEIGRSLTEPKKSLFWINAGIHAREWASSSTAIFIIDKLAKEYGDNGMFARKFRNFVWCIVPLLNPDGYEFTRGSLHPDVRLWRKNKSPRTQCPNIGPCCRGVDLNRNFNFYFGGEGSSNNPCDETYQGPFAFSEPEARAVRDFVLKHKDALKAFIDLHTYSQLWIHPYGHRVGTYPDDVNDLKSVAQKAVHELYKLYGTRYKVGSGADTLYPASGGMADWVKSAANVKYSYLIELRPSEWVYDGFILDPAEILPTARETWQGIQVVAEAVLQDGLKESQLFHKVS
uniref:Peptidase_M14 domain-containing protein n=1 Tax=Trichuris muris TaxID=70415 RepID=A0A5S6PZD8_TRIMR